MILSKTKHRKLSLNKRTRQARSTEKEREKERDTHTKSTMATTNGTNDTSNGPSQLNTVVRMQTDVQTILNTVNKVQSITVTQSNKFQEALNQYSIVQNVAESQQGTNLTVINELGRLKILVESLKADITDLLGLQLLQQQQSLLNRTAATTSSTTTSMGSPSFSAGGGGSSEQVTRVYQFNPELPRLPQIQDKMIFYNLFFQSQQGSVSSSSSSSASFADAGSHTRKKYETWKFLGRALFELHISKAICDMFQDSAESERLILKSVMISDENLTRWAKLYLFDGYLNYKDAVVVADKEKILADVFLAYVAAVYEDDAESTDRIKSWLKEILQYDLRTGSIRSYIEAHERKEQEKETQNNNTTTTTTTSQGTAPSASGASSSSTALDQDLAPWSKPFSEMTPEDQIKYAKDHLYSRLSPTFTPTYQILSQTKPPAQPSFETVCVVNGEVVGYGKSSNIKTAKAKAAFDAMLSNKAVIEKYELIRQNVVKNKKMGKPEMFPVSFEKQVAHLLGKRQLDRVTNGTHEEIDY